MAIVLGCLALIFARDAAIGLPDAIQDDDEPTAASPADDHEQVLREAFELLDDGDVPAALRAMQRVAGRAPRDVLTRLNAWTRTTRGTPLDELLAETRIRVARSSARGKTFDIRYATPFEAAALGRRLERMADECLQAEFDGRTVAKWARQPSDYRELRADSADLESRARTAAGILGARLKHDPRLRAAGERDAPRRTNESRRSTARPASAPAADARGDLIRQRDDLARLASHVRSLPGFTALTTRRDEPDDPTLREAERLEAERIEQERIEAERQRDDRREADSQPATQPASRPASRPASDGPR